MKEIPLTKGYVALVDDEDYERVNQYKWYVQRDGYNYYAVRNITIRSRKETRETGLPRQTLIYMHRFILDAPNDKDVDHRDHNGLDNRKKSNLRFCTKNQNMGNLLSESGVSKYKGVTWHNENKKWVARIGYEGKRIHLGCFSDEIEAAKTYDARARELFGEFAYLNFPRETRCRYDRSIYARTWADGIWTMARI